MDAINAISFISSLKDELNKPLPGKEVQFMMAHKVRSSDIDFFKPGNKVRPAGVLALLYPHNGDFFITLIKRTNRGPHSGQISFPGGGLEAGDVDLSYTALREANEEVGIDPAQVEILGELSDLFIPVSNSMVNPFVGYAAERPEYIIDPEEVQFVIEAPLSHLLDSTKTRHTDIEIRDNLLLKDVPYFDIHDHVVWGATAMILKELLVIIEKIRT